MTFSARISNKPLGRTFSCHESCESVHSVGHSLRRTVSSTISSVGHSPPTPAGTGTPMPGHTQGNVAAGAPGQPPYTSVPLESNRTPRPRSVGGASGTARRPLSRPAPAAHREIAANHCRAVPAHSHAGRSGGHAGRSSAAQAPARASPPPASGPSNLGVHAGLADRGRAAAAAGACAPTRRLQSATGEPQSHTASARRVANRPAPAHSTTAAATEPFASRRRRAHLTPPPPPQLTPPACALLRSKPRGMGGGRARAAAAASAAGCRGHRSENGAAALLLLDGRHLRQANSAQIRNLERQGKYVPRVPRFATARAGSFCVLHDTAK